MGRRPVIDSDDHPDRFLESYIDWREECAAVGRAYAAWRDGARRDRDVAFAAYRMALDREEHAARRFREQSADVPLQAA